jgi:SPP1 gp7 family putative phage head morphogenesis protein
LIARDQILKANADLSRTRMQRVGVTRYRWSTSRDVRVRADHAALEGTMQTFSDPPVVDQRTGRRANPGVDFQCRCVAIPVFDNDD